MTLAAIAIFRAMTRRQPWTWRDASTACGGALEAVWLIATAIVVFIVSQLVLVPFIRTSDEGGVATVSTAAQVGSYAAAIGLVALLHLAGRGKLSLRIGAARADVIPSIRWALLAAMVAVPLTMTVNALVQGVVLQFNNAPSVNPLLETLQQTTSTSEALWGAAVAVLLAPLLEEILFRGHLQTASVRLLGRPGAILGVSLLFALIHPQTHQPAIFTLSVLLGIAYERTGRLWVPIFMHMCFNAVPVLLTVLIRTAGSS